MRRIKAQCADISEATNQLPLIGRTKSIAAVLNQPEVMFGSESRNRIEVERIPQRVRKNNCLRPRRNRRLQLRNIDVICRKLHIHEDRHKPVLENRIDGRGKSSGHGDNFIARPKPAIAK